MGTGDKIRVTQLQPRSPKPTLKLEEARKDPTQSLRGSRALLTP